MRERDRTRLSARAGEIRAERPRGRRRADDRRPRPGPVARATGARPGARLRDHVGGYDRRARQPIGRRNRGADAPDARGAMKLADLEVSKDGDVVLARIVGEVDMSNADELRAALVAAIPAEAPGIVLDLSGVDYLDSAGIRMIY